MRIDEALLPHQAKAADEWAQEGQYPLAHNLVSGHIMKGEHTIILPLHEGGEEAEPHPAVESHLSAHGYKISDYKAGYAVEPKNSRIVRIGKALNQTKAPEHVVKAFNNDPSRMVKDDTNVEIAITHHPHQIAGMSTGRGWSSCLNMVDGSNRHYLSQEIAHGTHAAYLIHKGDHDIEKPIARIALKHFMSKTPSPEHERGEPGHDVRGHHHVLVPETSSYGSGDGGATTRFEDTVQKWTDKHFRMKEDRIYERSGDTYSDGMSNMIKPVSNGMITHHIDRGENPFYYADEHLVRKHHVEHALDYLRSKPADVSRDRLRAAVLQHQMHHATPAMVNREYMFDKANGALNATDGQGASSNTLLTIMTNRKLLDNLSSDHTHELLHHYSKFDDANRLALHNLVNSPKVSVETREAAVIRPDGKARLHLVSDPEHVTPKIAQGVMNAVAPALEGGDDFKVPFHAMSHLGSGNLLRALESKHFTTEHLSQLAKHVSETFEAQALARNPNFTADNHKAVMNAFLGAADHPKWNEETKRRAVMNARSYLAESPHATVEEAETVVGKAQEDHKRGFWKLFATHGQTKDLIEHALSKYVPHTQTGYENFIYPGAIEHMKNSPNAIHFLSTHEPATNIHVDEDLAEKVVLHDAQSHDIPGSPVSKDDQIRRAGMTAEKTINSAHFDKDRWNRIIPSLLDKGMYMRAGAAIKRKYQLGHGAEESHVERMREHHPRFDPAGY